MVNKLYLSLLLVFLFLMVQMTLAGYTRILLSESLPKTKDLRPLVKIDKKGPAKGKVDTKNPATQEKVETDKNTDQKDSEISESEEKEKEDPTQDYKLVGIYLIANQPRALIKKLSMSEDGAIEYQVGDYIDEEQALSISKILFNPTARIEIIDQDGLSYLIKPLSSDDKTGGTKAKGSYGAMSVPTYFSGGTSKQKTKKSPRGTETGATQGESSTTSTIKEKKEEDKPSQEAAAKKEESEATSQASTTQPGSSALQPTSQASGAPPAEKKEAQAAPTSKSPSDSLDVNRPANPFGQ